MAVCDIQVRITDAFVREGVIKKGTREILNMSAFLEMNEKYSEEAKQTYNLNRDEELFSIEMNERTKLRSRTVMRAEPNKEFFQAMQTIIDGDLSPAEVAEAELEKPEINLNFVEDNQLVDSNDPLANKKLQDQVRKEAEELQELINCIWK